VMLAEEGKGIRVLVYVESQYAGLVHANARFSMVEVFQTEGGLLGKFRLDLPVGGGIDMEVPNHPGPQVVPGQTLELSEKATPS
jgi:hypothetical protein